MAGRIRNILSFEMDQFSGSRSVLSPSRVLGGLVHVCSDGGYFWGSDAGARGKYIGIINES